MDPGVGDTAFPELSATVTDTTMTALEEVGATCDAADCNDPFMWTMPKGIGYYANTSSSSALIPFFEDIANSLPMAIVR